MYLYCRLHWKPASLRANSTISSFLSIWNYVIWCLQKYYKHGMCSCLWSWQRNRIRWYRPHQILRHSNGTSSCKRNPLAFWTYQESLWCSRELIFISAWTALDWSYRSWMVLWGEEAWPNLILADSNFFCVFRSAAWDLCSIFYHRLSSSFFWSGCN